MVEGGAGTEFPVVFYDGVKEINMGTIKVCLMQEFKAFQLMLSQRIGISPNQISIYLCDRRKDSILQHRRKIPITGKANFNLIAREKDCFFLVVLKRSRKSRNRKPTVDYGGLLTENLILLRRNKEMDLGSNFYDPYPNFFQRIHDTYPMMMTKYLVECEECKGKNVNFKTSTFHHCVNDPVIVGGFKSRFGPVHRLVN